MSEDYGEEQEQEQGGALVRTPNILPSRGETTSSALAMQARASVEARYLMALQNPRSMTVVRQELLAACKRPVFAAKARYALPRGQKTISGFTIRFAEEVARCMSNMLCESMVIYDDMEQRLVRCTVTHLSSGLTYNTDVVVRKTVERQSLRRGQKPIGERLNSEGVRVFIVEATDDDVAMKQASAVSKALRTGILRCCPADILEEAEDAVKATLAAKDAKDPAGEAKKIADSFYEMGVGGEEIEKFLGHKLALTTPTEVGQLRLMYVALREEGVKWADVLEVFAPEQNAEEKAGAAAVRQALKKREERKAAKGSETKSTETTKETEKPPVADTPAPAAAAPSAPPPGPARGPALVKDTPTPPRQREPGEEPEEDAWPNGDADLDDEDFK